MPLIPTCPLCHSRPAEDFHTDKLRRYFRCTQCALVFADPATLLLPAEEKAIYDHHENSPHDVHYRGFLDRLAKPLAERLGNQPLQGLDFGCGPGPALAIMLAEQGYHMAIYDPYYAPDQNVLAHQYDFITCTEAMEHFYTPAKEWQLLLAMLKPGGWLGVMTGLVTSTEHFTDWHYKNDPTHVSFFSRETFTYLSQTHCLQLEFVGDNVVFLKKPDSRI